MGFAAALIPAATSIIGGLISKGSKGREAEALRASGAEAGAQLQPFATGGVEASNLISNVLSGGRGADDAFKQFQESTGFRSMLKEGIGGIVGNQATKGLLNSGATLKRIEERGRQEAEQSFGNFLNLAGSQANRGVTAAGGAADIISGTGQRVATTQSEGADRFTSGLGAAAEGITNFFTPNRPLTAGGG